MARTAQEVRGDDAHAPTTTIAPPPFNKSSADTVLRTADHVNFRVRRAILEEASVVFADMFLLPQPSPGQDDRGPTEDMLSGLRSGIHLDELKPVLEAARKYLMDHVIEVLNKPLVLLAVAHPLQAYAVAVQFDLVDAARAAARLTLRYKDPCPFTRELDAIPATAYYHLQAYRCKCAEAACQAVRDLRWLDSASFVWFKMQTSWSYQSPSPSHQPPMANGSTIEGAAQAGEPHVDDNAAQSDTPPTAGPAPFNSTYTDIVLRSADHVDFHVWRGILREASAFFANMFTDADGGSSDAPLVPMTESSRTLESLLRLCYPVPDPEFASIDDLKPVMVAARKYQMDYIMQVLTRRLLIFAEKTPLQAYAVALQFDLVDAAKAAGRLTLRYDDPCPFTEELEVVPAAAYYRLLAYRRKCADVACQAVRDLRWLDDASYVWFKTRQGTCTCPCAPDFYHPKGSKIYITQWYQKHLDRVAAALSAKPYRDTVEAEELQGDQMFQDASSCNASCRASIHPHTRKFMSRLAVEVDKRVSAIDLEITTVDIADIVATKDDEAIGDVRFAVRVERLKFSPFQ
ncbi:hypothetical protein VTO73DRAFT_7398 [Trametes versicolor]